MKRKEQGDGSGYKLVRPSSTLWDKHLTHVGTEARNMPVHALATLKMVILVHSGARVGVYQGASKAEESGAERMEDGRKRVREEFGHRAEEDGAARDEEHIGAWHWTE